MSVNEVDNFQLDWSNLELEFSVAVDAGTHFHHAELKTDDVVSVVVLTKLWLVPNFVDRGLREHSKVELIKFEHLLQVSSSLLLKISDL